MSGRVARGGAFLRALRPEHVWKNVPVAAALLFGQRATDAGARANVALTFLAFCAVSSAGYLVNDVVDREADRGHPLRSARPVASGALAPAAALAGAGALFAGTLLAAARWLPAGVLAALGAYSALTLLYPTVLRRVPGAGPAAVSAGFVLRAWGGAPAAGVAASPWLLALTGALAAALVAAKREAEVRRAGGADLGRRARWTDGLLLLAAAGYLVWTQAPETVAMHATRALGWTALPVVAALVRFRARLRGDASGLGPAERVARDPVLLALAALWAALCAGIVYGG